MTACAIQGTIVGQLMVIRDKPIQPVAPLKVLLILKTIKVTIALSANKSKIVFKGQFQISKRI